MAAPFVEGRLRQKPLTVEIRTKCAHCDRRIDLSVDSELHYRVAQKDARPMVFEPRVDWSAFREPNIIHHY